jgi:hypothetical protein
MDEPAKEPVTDRAAAEPKPEPEPKPKSEPTTSLGEEPYVETARDRRIANLILIGFLVVVIGGGIWLANAMFNQRQLDDCMAQGRRNCGPAIDVPQR